MLLVALVGSACSDSPPRVPTGVPLEVVRASADRTEQGGPATVFIDAPGESIDVELDLARDAGPPRIRSRVLAALDVARRATEAVAYGGQQVRGTSTMRYEVTPEAGGDADVWVDVAGRARRVQFPVGSLTASPPPTQANGLPALVTIDFVFPEGPPTTTTGPVLQPGPPDL